MGRQDRVRGGLPRTDAAPSKPPGASAACPNSCPSSTDPGATDPDSSDASAAANPSATDPGSTNPGSSDASPANTSATDTSTADAPSDPRGPLLLQLGERRAGLCRGQEVRLRPAGAVPEHVPRGQGGPAGRAVSSVRAPPPTAYDCESDCRLMPWRVCGGMHHHLLIIIVTHTAYLLLPIAMGDGP
jgi:hypothetical protein